MSLLLGPNLGDYKQEMAYFLQHALSNFPSLPLDGIMGGFRSSTIPFSRCRQCGVPSRYLEAEFCPF